MKRILCLIGTWGCLACIGAQDLNGVWLARYQREAPGNSRSFYYRFFLHQSGDSVWGYGEALPAATDIGGHAAENAKAVSRFRLTAEKLDPFHPTAAITLYASEEGNYFSATTQAERPPLFLQFNCAFLAAPQPAMPVNYSVLPFNDGAVAEVTVYKLRNWNKGEGAGEAPVEEEQGALLARQQKGAGGNNEKEKAVVAPLNPDSLALTRKQEVQHSITTSAKEIWIALYDNGVIDDDTVSLFFNNGALLRAQRLSTKPLELQVQLTETGENTLSLFAHNLGAIAPNTALMVVTTGGRRHELSLSSSLHKNALVTLRLEGSGANTKEPINKSQSNGGDHD